MILMYSSQKDKKMIHTTLCIHTDFQWGATLKKINEEQNIHTDNNIIANH